MLYLTVRKNAELNDWSMYKTEDNHILSMDDHVGKGDRVHFVFYSHGYYAEKWRFWIEFKVSYVLNCTTKAFFWSAGYSSRIFCSSEFIKRT